MIPGMISYAVSPNSHTYTNQQPQQPQQPQQQTSVYEVCGWVWCTSLGPPLSPPQDGSASFGSRTPCNLKRGHKAPNWNHLTMSSLHTGSDMLPPQNPPKKGCKWLSKRMSECVSECVSELLSALCTYRCQWSTNISHSKPYFGPLSLE